MNTVTDKDNYVSQLNANHVSLILNVKEPQRMTKYPHRSWTWSTCHIKLQSYKNIFGKFNNNERCKMLETNLHKLT